MRQAVSARQARAIAGLAKVADTEDRQVLEQDIATLRLTTRAFAGDLRYSAVRE